MNIVKILFRKKKTKVLEFFFFDNKIFLKLFTCITRTGNPTGSVRHFVVFSYIFGLNRYQHYFHSIKYVHIISSLSRKTGTNEKTHSGQSCISINGYAKPCNDHNDELNYFYKILNRVHMLLYIGSRSYKF